MGIFINNILPEAIYCCIISCGQSNTDIRCPIPGAYEPPEGRKDRPTLHYSVERLNAIKHFPYMDLSSSGDVRCGKCCKRAPRLRI